jgi:hypothetical protein
MTLLRESEMGASGSVTFANKKEFRNGKLWRSNLMATNLTLKLGKSRSLLVAARADTESAWWKKGDSATPTSSTPASATPAIRQALDVARASPAIEGFVLPSAQEAAPVDGLCDRRILDIGPEDLLEQADAVLSEVASLDERAVVTGGGLGVGATASAILSSEGIESLASQPLMALVSRFPSMLMMN